MTRQTPTAAERAQVNNDFDLFQLPFSASLDVGDFTVYGTTDPAIDLSMVNMRHLLSRENFRGLWQATAPNIEGTAFEYQEGQVVIGSDNHLYMLTSSGDPRIDPTTISQTDWVLIGGRDATVSEFRSVPDSQDLNLFSGANQVMYQISPAPGNTLVNPTAESDTTGVTQTISNTGALAVTIPNQVTEGQVITTITSQTTDGTSTFQASSIESVTNLVDGRQSPLVTPEDGRVSIIDTTQRFIYTVTRAPMGTSLTDGTAYDVNFTVNSGTVQTGNTFQAPTIIANTDFTFSFPLVGNPSNGQVGTPDDIVRSLSVYTPWFWGFSPTVPVGMAGLTEGVYTGQTQGNDFVSGMSFSVTGTTGAVNTFWLAVPTSVSNNIVLSTGLANVPGVRTTNTFDIPNALNSGNINYTLHRFLVGLVMSPTVFTTAITS